MEITPYLITYDYYSPNVGSGTERTTLIIEAEEGGISGWSEVYAAAYAPQVCMTMATYLIENQNADIPFCTESGIGRAVKSSIELALLDLDMRQREEKIPSDQAKVYSSAGSLALGISEVREESKRCKKLGYKYHKIRAGKDEWYTDMGRITAALDVFGENNVAVDLIANTMGHPSSKLMEGMKRLPLLWTEEPFPASQFAFMNHNQTHLKDQRIIAGEWATTEGEITVINRATGNMQVDFSQFGWVGHNAFLGRIAKESEIIAIHAWCSKISQRIGTLGNYLVEEDAGTVYCEIPIVSSELNDHTELTNGPGFGLEIDKNWLRKAAGKKSTAFAV
jgi:L-alanine-DL-glutamate epimerase-like enolase superfamily enzyme|tara:strand:+ start:12572 stop:13579 length:1008 start_codon:yes stop_codon:yes gene_type:complete